jgi:hypothetical protein
MHSLFCCFKPFSLLSPAALEHARLARRPERVMRRAGGPRDAARSGREQLFN